MRILSAAETRQALPFPALMERLKSIVIDYRNGTVICPERLVVPTAAQKGTILSMVACGPRIMAHKLLTVFPHNQSTPTLQGLITCLSAEDGQILFVLDGITTTERRTAAMSMLGLACFRPPRLDRVLLIGTGAQARVHLDALNELHPGLTVSVRGRTARHVETLIRGPYPNLHLQKEEKRGEDYDLVLTVTSSQNILYDNTATADTLVIGVGAYQPHMVEVGPSIVQGSVCVVDDPVGAPFEAGDIIQAGKDWSSVKPLAHYLAGAPREAAPIFFKSVGCAAWDLAACDVVSRSLA